MKTPKTPILIGDFNALQSLILGGKLLDGHFSVGIGLAVLMLLAVVFQLLQQLGNGFAKFLFAQLSAGDHQGYDSLFNFFLHDLSRSFPPICRENAGTLRRYHQPVQKMLIHFCAPVP